MTLHAAADTKKLLTAQTSVWTRGKKLLRQSCTLRVLDGRHCSEGLAGVSHVSEQGCPCHGSLPVSVWACPHVLNNFSQLPQLSSKLIIPCLNFIAIDSLTCNFLLPRSLLTDFFWCYSSLDNSSPTMHSPSLFCFFLRFPPCEYQWIPRCAFLARHYPWPSKWMHLFLPTVSKDFLAEHTASLHSAPNKIFK